MKKLFVSIMILVLALSFFGCTKKTAIDTEEVVEETTEAEVDAAPETGTSEKRTLPVIGPNDTLEILSFPGKGGEPYTFGDENGKLSLTKGFTTEILIKVLENMGQKYNITGLDEISPEVDYQLMYQKVKAGDYHMLFGVTYDESVLKQYNVTDNMGFERMKLFVHKDNKDFPKGDISREELSRLLSGKVVGVANAQKEALKELSRDVKIDIAENERITRKKVADGEIDAALLLVELHAYQVQLNNEPLITVGPPVIQYEFGVAFTKTIDDEIVERYNKEFRKLKDQGVADDIFAKYGILDMFKKID